MFSLPEGAGVSAPALDVRNGHESKTWTLFPFAVWSPREPVSALFDLPEAQQNSENREGRK
jgi:hypothetical protein